MDHGTPLLHHAVYISTQPLPFQNSFFIEPEDLNEKKEIKGHLIQFNLKDHSIYE